MPDITPTPPQADPQAQFAARVNEFIDRALFVARDGLTWAEFGQIYQEFLQMAVNEARNLAVAGYQKKQSVLAALSAFLHQVPLPLPWWLAPIRPAVVSWLIALADGAIEEVYRRIKPAPANVAI